MSQSKADIIIPLLLVGIVVLQLFVSIGLVVQVKALRKEIRQVMAVARASSPTDFSEEGLEIGTLAPDFTLIDTSGNEVSLGDFEGKKIVLVFASPDCPVCTDLYGPLKAFADQHRDDLQVIMLSDRPPEDNKMLVIQQRFSFPVLSFADSLAVVETYNVKGVPFMFFIDESGTIINKGIPRNLKEMNSFIGNE